MQFMKFTINLILSSTFQSSVDWTSIINPRSRQTLDEDLLMTRFEFAAKKVSVSRQIEERGQY